MSRPHLDRFRPPPVFLALALAALAPVGGCVYYNGLYNARQAFHAGEHARVEGRPDSARTSFQQALAGAERAWIAEPEGGWADDALLLRARSALRLHEVGLAREALDLLAAGASDGEVERRAAILRGALAVLSGDPEGAVSLLDPALLEEGSSSWQGEAHLWRGRAHLRSGRVEAGFVDLDRAIEADPTLRRVVTLESLDRAIGLGDRSRAGRSASELFRDPAAAAWADSIGALVTGAEERWSAREAAELLAPLRSSRWSPEPRDRLLLRRAGLLLEIGDSVAASEELGWLAEGSGRGAVEARLLLADLRLGLATTFAELVAARGVLLPMVSDPRGRERLQEIGQVELLAGWGSRGDPVAYFVAGELARDHLHASRLARALFLTAAEMNPEGPWAGKALLAALLLADTPELELRIRQRVRARREDPYIERARPGYHSSEIHEIWEEELTWRIRELRAAAAEEALRYIPGEGGAGSLPALGPRPPSTGGRGGGG